MNSKAQFWNRKILRWEHEQYDLHPCSPVKKRLDTAAQMIARHARGLRLLDFGCGSGRLFGQLSRGDYAQLRGLDISEVAISRAKATYQNSPQMIFDIGGVEALSSVDCELIVSMGVIDWLDEVELKQFLAYLAHRKFLVSFSNRDAGLIRVLHSLYVNIRYGWRTGGYRPKYYSHDHLARNLTTPTVQLGLDGDRLVSFLTNLPVSPLTDS